MELLSYLENCSIFGQKCQVSDLFRVTPALIKTFLFVTRFLLRVTLFICDQTFLIVCDISDPTVFEKPFFRKKKQKQKRITI